MKIKYILPLMAVGVLAGCAALKVEGTDFDTYIQKNGAPTSEYIMQNGNKLYTYKKLCPNKKNWQEYNVEVSSENIIVKRKYITNCTYWSELDSYIQKHGVPTSEYEMQNGNKLYIYKTLCPDRITWQEYNVEVTPKNTIIKTTNVKSCPTLNSTSNLQSINRQNDPLKQKYNSLSIEYSDTVNQMQTALSEWTEYIHTKGALHKDTLSARERYNNLRKKYEELQTEMDELKKQIN